MEPLISLLEPEGVFKLTRDRGVPAEFSLLPLHPTGTFGAVEDNDLIRLTQQNNWCYRAARRLGVPIAVAVVYWKEQYRGRPTWRKQPRGVLVPTDDVARVTKLAEWMERNPFADTPLL